MLDNRLINLLFWGFLAGIISANHYSGGYVWLYAMAIAIISLLGICRQNKILGQASFVMLFYVLGTVRGISSNVENPEIVLHFGQTVTIGGEVSNVPQITRVDEQNFIFRYIVIVDSIVPEGHPKVYYRNCKVMVVLKQGKQNDLLGCGQKVIVKGKLLPVNSNKNPGAIDVASILWHQQIYAKVSKAQIISAGKQPTMAAIVQKALFWRNNVIRQMETIVEKNEAAELAAFLFGGYDGINKVVLNDLAATGLIHIISVSGSHIALIAGVFLWIGKQAKLRDWMSIIFAICGLFLYAVVTGFTPPVVRSLIMGILGLFAMALKRDRDAATAFAIAGMGMLIYQPGLIYDVSFQLSYGATAGLVFIYPRVCKALHFLPKWSIMPVAVTVSAQLGVLPFLAWYFNSISLSSLLANIVILPFIEIIIVAGLCSIVLLYLIPCSGIALIWCCGCFIIFTNLLLHIFALLPASSVYVPTVGFWHGLTYYIFLAWFCGMHPRSIPACNVTIKKYWLYIGIFILLWGAASHIYPANSISVHFIDVGQGDATLLITPQKHAVLIDAGGIPDVTTAKFDVGERVIVPYLRHFGIRKLDYLILTHGHQDHAGGAAFVAASVPVDNILLNAQEKTEAVQALLKVAANQKHIINPWEGQTFFVDGVKITVLKSNEENRKGNEASNVVKIKFGRSSFLITGDLQAQEENELIADNIDVSANVLKLGHHGSNTSSTSEFLRVVAPRYAVISVGAGNQFGHPSPDTLERLFQQNITVYRTDKHGAVIFQTDGLTMNVKTYQ